ncbi:hypothetical protein EW146_g4943 [Bondarzewia mesenterica]|uniref:Uncharacterized protein n=1 Tax=Bondarzewia mesenterica TaxID=1095465 RepID=A0A4S4LSY7_9AGAM|nr:hypothetical protein EW146_g4943 [Bondarzewia mesenterica]
MDENAALFTVAKIIILTRSLEDWLSQKQSRPKGTMPDIPLKKARYIAKLRKEITDWFEFQLPQKLVKDKINYFCHWTAAQVIQKVKKKEVQAYIDEKHSIMPATSRQFIAHYQEALREIKAKLSASELKNLAEKYGHQYIKEFVRQMYKQLSMRVFVLHASQNKDKKTIYTYHNYNEENGTLSFIKTYPEWATGNILEDWGNYAKKSFAVSPGDAKAKAKADGAEASKKNGKKPLLELAFAEDGRVMLPAMKEGNQPDLEQMKGLVWSVMTATYREVTSNEKSDVPWSDLKEHQSEYINVEYLPEGYHWHARQAKEKHLVVFEGYKDKDGGAVFPSEGPREKKGKATAALAKSKAKGKGKGKAPVRVAVKETEDNADADGQSDDAKADADDDDEDIIRQLQALEGSDNDNDESDGNIEDEASFAQMEE